MWYLIKRVGEPGPGNAWKQGRRSLINQHKCCIQLGSSNILHGISTSVQPLGHLVATQCGPDQSTFSRLRNYKSRCWINWWNFKVAGSVAQRRAVLPRLLQTRYMLCKNRDIRLSCWAAKNRMPSLRLPVWEFLQFALSTSSGQNFLPCGSLCD